MRFHGMKWLDHWTGLPLCTALGALERLTVCVRPRRHASPAEPRTIVVSKFFGIGSIILISPLLKALRRRYPSARIVFLTFKAHVSLLRQLDNSIETMAVDASSLAAFARDTLKCLLAFSLRKPDIAIDLEFYSKFATIILYLTGAPVRIGYHLAGFWRSSLITVPINFNYNRHIVETYEAVARAAGAHDYDGNDLTRIASLMDEPRGILRRLGWNGSDRIVGVNVNASDLAYCRRWGADKFAAVIAGIARMPDTCVVLTGSAQEKEYVASVTGLLEPEAAAKIVNSAGAFSLDQFIAFAGMCALFVTNDSGPLHVAYARGVGTVSLWGPGTPSLYGPMDGRRNAVVYSRFPCSPCMYIYRTDAGLFCGKQAPCLEAITPESVLNEVSRLLA